MKVETLEEAIEKIKELEKEITRLRTENEKLRSRNYGGRKKHDSAWMNSYNDFVIKYENGMTRDPMVQGRRDIFNERIGLNNANDS